MFRFLTILAFFILLVPAPAQAFQLGTYTCTINTLASIQANPNKTSNVVKIQPAIKTLTLKLEPFTPNETCNAVWGQEKHPHECHAKFQARFDPALIPHEPVLYGMKQKEPDVYFGKSSYVHFTDNVLFHAAWSRYGEAMMAKGRCERQNITNN